MLISVPDYLTQSSPARAPCRWASFEASVRNCAKVVEVRLLPPSSGSFWRQAGGSLPAHDVIGAQRGDNNMPALNLEREAREWSAAVGAGDFGH